MPGEHAETAENSKNSAHSAYSVVNSSMWKEDVSFSPLDLLRRTDKITLGGGRMVIWAPEFPLWADRPGFWDHATFLEHKVEPLFTLTLLDSGLREIPLALQARSWTPALLSQDYLSRRSGPDPLALPAPPWSEEAVLRVQEDKSLSPQDVLLSSLTITNLRAAPQALTVILWTAIPRGSEKDGPWIDGGRVEDGKILFIRRARGGGVVADSAIAFALGADRRPSSFSLNHSEWSTGRTNYPRWELTPFYENITSKGLPNHRRTTGGPYENAENTLLYMALAYPMTLAEAETLTITFGCALAPEPEEAFANLNSECKMQNAESGIPHSAFYTPAPHSAPLRGPWPAAGAGVPHSEARWRSFFNAAPEFHCSDSYLERYYYYRLFGLRLNTVEAGGRFNLSSPAIFEGINGGWFRHQISYSSHALMREARWFHDPAVARGLLENFIANQRDDGSFVGGIMTGPGAQIAVDFMYHADWGAAIQALYSLHPDDDWLARIAPGLMKYARYYKVEHDREDSGLYDVRNQAETGQEYMARYLFVDRRADRWGPLRLKGVDATVYAYNLNRALAWLCEKTGADPVPYTAEAQAIRSAILERMWDPERRFFFDVHPETGEHSPAMAAIGFYPFLTDIPGPEHLPALDYLFDPAYFGTPYPLPATAVSDPTFSAFGEWKNRRHVCPWNGRAWLMTTSHVCQALAHTALRTESEVSDFARRRELSDSNSIRAMSRAGYPGSLREAAADLIRRHVHALFVDGDLARPCSFEYYNPLTGQQPYFRGTDDYMHSWILDLILQFVAGLQPNPDEGVLAVDPLPFGLEHFSVERAVVWGRRVAVEWRSVDGLRVLLEGQQVAHRPDLGRLEINLH